MAAARSAVAVEGDQVDENAAFHATVPIVKVNRVSNGRGNALHGEPVSVFAVAGRSSIPSRA
jgi:hypothetical protein